MSLEWFSYTTEVWPLLNSECPEWLMQTFTLKVGFQKIPSPLWTLRMCSSPLPDQFFMTSLSRRFTSFMYILGPSKDSWGALCGFLEFFSTELPFLWNVLSPHNYHLLQTPWTSISVRCPCSVRTPLSALRPGVGLQANNWDGHRVHLPSFPFLRNESCTDSCSMSENSCFMYLVQTSSCLRWQRNLGPRTSSRLNRIGF